MQIDFDSAKDAQNLAKHGVSLEHGVRIFDDADAVFLETFRVEDQEDRLKVVGIVGQCLWTAVYVDRGHTLRFISVRRSNECEQRAYHRNRG